MFNNHQRQYTEGYSHQAFQPSEGAAASISPSGAYPCRFEMPWYIEDSLVSISVAHDLERVGNDAIVVKGNHWMISSKISTGSSESIIVILLKAGQNWGWSTVSVAEYAGDRQPSGRSHPEPPASWPNLIGIGGIVVSCLTLPPSQRRFNIFELSALGKHFHSPSNLSLLISRACETLYGPRKILD